MKNIIRFHLKEALAVAVISMMGLAFSFAVSEAHTDPAGCVASGVSLSIVTYRSDGTTPIGAGTVDVGETIKYEAILSHAGSPNCNYSGGNLNIITPDGVTHDVDGGTIPLISAGSPFISTQVTYVVSVDDIDGDSDVDASADYTGGTSHLGDNNVSPVGATAPAASVVTAQIIVDKVSSPSSEQDFEFDPSWGDNFFLDDTDAPATSGPLAAGSYSVAEVNIPSGWVASSTSCVSSLGDTETAGALDLDAGETITCTFNNTQPTGNIIVAKETNPDGDAQSFEFDPSWGDNFSLTDGQNNNSGTLTAGDYSVTEVNMPDNWEAGSTTCVSSIGDTETAGDLELDAGETITCTFNNTFTPPVVAQYCSPGYWKQSQHFDSWVDYAPTDMFASVFGENITIMWSAKGKPVATTNPTLLQVLEANGGGISSLARAAVDALLNASALETEMSPAEVISAFQDTYPGTDAQYEALKAEYTTAENCPLN